jgi:hypothetical protein
MTNKTTTANKLTNLQDLSRIELIEFLEAATLEQNEIEQFRGYVSESNRIIDNVRRERLNGKGRIRLNQGLGLYVGLGVLFFICLMSANLLFVILGLITTDGVGCLYYFLKKKKKLEQDDTIKRAEKFRIKALRLEKEYTENSDYVKYLPSIYQKTFIIRLLSV